MHKCNERYGIATHTAWSVTVPGPSLRVVLAGLGYPIVGPPVPSLRSTTMMPGNAVERERKREREGPTERRDRDASVPDNRSDCLLPGFLEYDCYYYPLAHALSSLDSGSNRSRIFLVPRQVRLPSLPILLYLSCLLAFFGEIRFFPLLIL